MTEKERRLTELRRQNQRRSAITTVSTERRDTETEERRNQTDRRTENRR